MTKERRPLTFERALCRVAELIGYDGCAQLLGCSENWVRKLSDPDAEREISLQKARRLDLAYLRAGGYGRPFLECYELQLEMGDETGGSSTGELIAAAGKAAKETGEAVGAALAAIERGRDAGSVENALREIEEGIEALTGVANRLRVSGNGGTGRESGHPN
ncbi:hypothetical protein M2336_001918 [Sphingobium sp. B1D7B]|uniref:hypothetical protein n=1 Tax=Sphingobium TaxID=165695 RepID=UPI0015EB2F8B|nr:MULTISPECIES: hypothetical protein [Sphingobium]MCW2362427.1 hypothetical protein [Sphingobium sp. B10D3B]MCW2400894.1 hypothetical protein [Sphingobium sp. B10D7B]MCW2405289.1 hypothetical protein [Sphingobium sp. B1D7B]MCW2407873.1 hypothetical protein [Sphingobium xanthum]